MGDSGAIRYLRKYSDSLQMIEWIPSVGCEQKIAVSTSRTNFITCPGGDISVVTVYVQDASENKYYLRVNTLTHQVTLECEQAYLTVRKPKKSLNSYVLNMLLSGIFTHTEGISF